MTVFSDILADLQAEENSNQRKSGSQDEKIFSRIAVSCSSENYCFDIKYGINFRVFKFRAMFFSRVLNFAITYIKKRENRISVQSKSPRSRVCLPVPSGQGIHQGPF